MVVRLRWMRFGRKDGAFFRLVAADHKSPRDGKFIETVRRRCICIAARALHSPLSRMRSLACALARARSCASQLGTYNPQAMSDGVKELRLKLDRVKYWVGVGAQPSESVARMLGRINILPPFPIRYRPQYRIPKDEREQEKKQ